MAYVVNIKPGHPTGRMMRAGVMVEKGKGVIFDDVPEAIRNEFWFEIERINKDKAEKLIEKGEALDMRTPVEFESGQSGLEGADRPPEATE